MMAGVVAMASVIEDFDTQPCKKSRKDGGSPVVQTITNYFSPVPKPVEKPFPPPRSNNIMNYFSRKAPPSQEKASPPQESNDKDQKSQSAEKNTSSDAGKQSSGKRGRKTSKAARKLVASEDVCSADDSRCVVIEDARKDDDSTAGAVSGYGTLGSDAAALLSKLSVESGKSGAVEAKMISDEQNPDKGSKCENGVQLEMSNTTELSPAGPAKVEVKKVTAAARKSKKKPQKETMQKEPERSLCDVSMEVDEDETSQLNSSTVTISFEDFVRSQNKTEEIKDDESQEEDGKGSAETEESNSEKLDASKAEVLPDQVSPRTVTIQAEVYVVSAKQKVASIFNRRKVSSSPVEIVEDETPAPASTVKRKSNVVLQEEDLELSVIESESTPKCSEAERKQFMAAFKQPSLDGSKAKPVKSQPKQKQSEEKTLEAAGGDVVISPSVEQVSQEIKAAQKKPTRRGRRKAKDEKEAVPSSPAPSSVEETVKIDKAGDKEEEPPIDSAPALRRSRREAAVRNTPETTQTSPVRKSRRLKESKDAASPQDCPVKRSTPKTRRSKHGVFVAEMVGPPDTKESPIRIKFSRIHKKAESGSTPSNKVPKASKKQKQAKKLVEKAKMIQQSKTGVEKEALRRSSRVKTSIRTSYHEDEDSVVFVEDLTTSPQKAPGKRKTQKPLRSLNDVLGKATSAGKETKTVPGSKLSQEKSARKASAVISIFDESSREGSENSQDDEQFRARREFLKSGLPESFRKQIARTAATKEAYSVSSSSFQLVTHTTQPPDDCPLWSLPWPESSLLGHLKEMMSQTFIPLPSVSGSLSMKMLPACRSFNKKGSGWRPEISESDRQLLMEEFRTSNPHFPAQIFFTRFLKRRADHQRQITASSEPEAGTTPAEPVGGKRKRRDDEREHVVKVAKKQKSNHLEETVSEADKDPPRRGGRTRRGLRSRLEEEEKTKPIPPKDDSVIVIDDLILEEDSVKKDVVKEDLLWTEKYQPQHSSDIVDNTAAVRRLYGWLKEWKLHADREERKNQKDKRPEEGSTDSDWDCGGEDFPDGDDALCNTLLITGPTGVGKTAAVYACAQELGFKVFEVNASSQRSGRLILSQLKEATQSHQVDSQGVNAFKPTFFNSYGASSSSAKLGSSPRKVNSPRKVVSSPRKTPQSPRGAKKGGLAPTSLDKFFKNPPTSKVSLKTTKTGDEAPGDKNKTVPVKSPPASSAAEKSSEEHKKAATSLILFEEVDVIFEDDAGFLGAIKTFMSTTKRPVILTTSDPAFSTMFDGRFEEIHFRTPSPANVGSYLQLLCLAEDIRTNQSDVTSLLKLNGCDIRQSLLQLQFWTRSSGGRPEARPLTHPSQNAELKPESDEAAADASVLPPCDTGCTESKLGLNVEPERNIWDLLRSQSLMEEEVCWDLLTDSKRRGVDLLYSNMEKLLPLPVTQLTTSKLSKPERRVSPAPHRPNQQLVSTSLQSDSLLESEDGSPIKVSNRMKKKKKRQHLPGRGGLQSGSDSEDGFPSLCRQQINPQTDQVPESISKMIKRTPLTEDERRKGLPVSQCLDSIADFWDSMSYVDSSLRFHPEGVHRVTPLSSAVIKDGMLDESRVETSRGSSLTGGRVLDIQAAVEALSFQKCRVSVTEAWDKGKEAADELALPVAAHRDGYSFTPDGPCHPQLVQRRKEVTENLTFQVFGTLGNRDAVSLDYLPAMRTICRSEQLKEQGKVKRRFLHYLDAIHLGLEKSTLMLLAEDFP